MSAFVGVYPARRPSTLFNMLDAALLVASGLVVVSEDVLVPGSGGGTHTSSLVVLVEEVSCCGLEPPDGPELVAGDEAAGVGVVAGVAGFGVTGVAGLALDAVLFDEPPPPDPSTNTPSVPNVP